MSSHLPAELLQAYAQTDFIVWHGPPFTMHIDVASSALASVMAAHNAVGAAFLTAYNPFSQQLPDAQNRKRQAQLKADMAGRRLKTIPGMGRHPANGWAGEPSLLVLDIDLESARAIAAEYGQNAFVWAAGDAVPQLMLS